MIEVLSSWAKGIGVTIVIVSIFEMILPNNKTKKYIRMVLGVFVIFNIISPFIQNKEKFDISQIDLGETYQTTVAASNINQTSMDERIEDLYQQELEKDITKKIEEKGYEVSKCKVSAKLSKEEKDQIKKIRITIQKKETNQKEQEEQETENKIVTEIQKIKKVDTKVYLEEEKEEKESSEKSQKVTKAEIQNIKKFLIEEYGVNEKCLEIN